MNEFEKRINALRIQFREERVQITKDCKRKIGHLNTAIGKVNSPEARDALRAEKARTYEASKTAIRYNRLCYLQQLEAIEDEGRMHFKKNPSNRQIRHALRSLMQSAQEKGQSSVSFALDENQSCTITFN